ncbi:replicative DNA helicase [Hoyosella sp. YIM 151337]|uniref:DnaB-like helicase N-terminal domain-containing protein n=1 Tax=Hoyosella sp. YIM 151337 TaxID=2992742 RepID=UPI0022366C7F|nr:DnaB-like helicase N-terminal domain-containing protein [Hoyosella sp. YIM 151337]MCW4354084.1 replicative DNA helicase [Hoyosella sp. YIM 151337]
MSGTSDIYGSDFTDDDNPDLNPELQLLSALLWAPPRDAATAAGMLEEADFYRPLHGQMFSIIAGLACAGSDHRAPSVLAHLSAGEQIAGDDRRSLIRLLTRAATGGADPLHLSQLVYVIASEAHRRAYYSAASQLRQAAESAAEAELFPLLLTLGRAHRSHENRMKRIRQWAGRNQ